MQLFGASVEQMASTSVPQRALIPMDLSRVTAELGPAIYVFLASYASQGKARMPGTIRAPTPVFDGLWPGMTTEKARLVQFHRKAL